MTINQLSIFLENKKGTLQQVLDLLKRADIQLIATTIADTVEYGILRIICSEPARAYQVLKDGGIAVALSDVFAIRFDNQIGRAADIIALFACKDININYLYSFITKGNGILVFRTNNADKAREIIILNRLQFITENELNALRN